MPQSQAHRASRLRQVAARVGMVMAAMVLAAGVAVLTPPRGADAAGCSSPRGAGEVRVVIVVDPGASGAPSSVCMVVPEGTTGSQLLARRAAEIGAAAPRYASSGLLCAIDGHPSSGCGDRTAGGYAYWAYFAGGSGSWIYGNNNPFIKRLRDGDVEGWRFVDGAGDGQDPPPRLGPTGLFPAVVAPNMSEMPIEPAPAAVADVGDPSSVDGPDDTVVDAAVPVDSTTTTSVDDTDATQLASAIGADATSAGGSGSSSALIAVVVVLAVIAALGAGAIVRARRGS